MRDTALNGHHQALQRRRLTSWVGGEGRSPPAKGISDAICRAVRLLSREPPLEQAGGRQRAMLCPVVFTFPVLPVVPGHREAPSVVTDFRQGQSIIAHALLLVSDVDGARPTSRGRFFIQRVPGAVLTTRHGELALHKPAVCPQVSAVTSWAQDPRLQSATLSSAECYTH